MNDLLDIVREKAKQLKKTIVLAEGEEPRIITAAAKAQAEGQRGDDANDPFFHAKASSYAC